MAYSKQSFSILTFSSKIHEIASIYPSLQTSVASLNYLPGGSCTIAYIHSHGSVHYYFGPLLDTLLLCSRRILLFSCTHTVEIL